ncbi:MAG TPA: hypothetical protein RMH80_21690, partial [Polyangiaceae bacterium LLY-WYZ-15_(1-7)]|nr:hypothetical protein [Polyangiaceae bacterium LLY-WYZ-15_(1-7)]
FTVVLAALSCGVVTGCSGCAESTSGSNETIEFALRTGHTCAEGCDLSAALPPGTEERIELRADVDLTGVTAESSDPGVLAAWIENTALCCAGATCSPMGAGTSCEAGELLPARPMLVVRALSPGEATLRVRSHGEVLDAVQMQVGTVSQVVATPALPPVNDGLIDVIITQNPVIELPPELILDAVLDRLRSQPGVEAASVDGTLDELRVRMGQSILLRLEAQDASGHVMHASRGITARIADAEIAALVPPGLHGEGGLSSLAGEILHIRPQRPGVTELTLSAGEQTTTLSVVVDRPCDPISADVVMSDQVCETDADCVPAECCHASACTAAGAAPSCDDVACTADCQEGTLDCGGRCLCLQGRCAAYLSQMDDPTCEASPEAPMEAARPEGPEVLDAPPALPGSVQAIPPGLPQRPSELGGEEVSVPDPVRREPGLPERPSPL